MTDICSSTLYSNQTICAVMQALDDLSESATETKDLALASLDTLQADVADGIAAMQGIDYTPGTDGIDNTFNAPGVVPVMPDFSALGPVAPTFPTAPTVGTLAAVDAAPAVPAAHTVPAATTKLIDDSTFDDIYDREAERITEVGEKRERDAVYRAASMGIGGASAALAIGLKEAEEQTNQDISGVAQDKAIAEGEFLREDVKVLHGLHIQNWPLKPGMDLESYKTEEGLEIEAFKAQEGAAMEGYASVVSGLASAFDAQVKWAVGYLDAESKRYGIYLEQKRVEIAEEAERRGWSELQMKTALEEADKATSHAIQKSQYILETMRQTSNTTAEIIGSLASAIYSAADYNLSGRGSQSVNETV